MTQLEQIAYLEKDNKYYLELWHKVCLDLQSHYGKDVYKSWFSKINFYQSTNNNLIILSAPTNFIRDWIKTNYSDMIFNLLSHHDDSVKSVDIITMKDTTE